MKKTVQMIYIVLFLAIIGFGTLFNLPRLLSITAEAVGDNEYEAWSTVIDLEYSDKFLNKYDYVNVNGAVHEVLGQREMNGVVKLDNGKLVVVLEERPVWQQAQKTVEFYNWLREQQIEFSYVQVPYEICKYDSQLPAGVEDYSNVDADLFLELIGEEGVPFLDLREVLHGGGMEHYEAFFQTDHHWTIETAFWAYGAVTEHLEDVFAVEVPQEYTDIASYHVEVYEDCVLGSNGRKTGIVYGGLDDLTLIYPAFPTEVSFEAPEEGFYREGDFEEAYMNYSFLEGESLYEMSQYNVYIGEDYPTTEQLCEGAPVDKKILLIKDSYFRPVQAFLGTTFSQVNTLDMRYFTGSVKEYIERVQPDVVLLCYNPYMVHDMNNFEFE